MLITKANLHDTHGFRGELADLQVHEVILLLVSDENNIAYHVRGMYEYNAIINPESAGSFGRRRANLDHIHVLNLWWREA